MDLFSDYDDIFGKAETIRLSQLTQEFATLVATIRSKLGKQDYLLDQYITMFIEAASVTPLHTAAEDGFSSTCDFRRLCQSVMDEKTDFAKHPLYGKVSQYIEQHPLEYQEEATRLELCYIALADVFMENAAAEYRTQLREQLQNVLDLVFLNELYCKITSILGSATQMTRLQAVLRLRFLLVSPMAGFVQGLTNELMGCMMHRDAETSKLAVQLWLENVEVSR